MVSGDRNSITNNVRRKKHPVSQSVDITEHGTREKLRKIMRLPLVNAGDENNIYHKLQFKDGHQDEFGNWETMEAYLNQSFKDSMNKNNN